MYKKIKGLFCVIGHILTFTFGNRRTPSKFPKLFFFPVMAGILKIKRTFKWYYWSDITSPCMENGDFEKEWGPENSIVSPWGPTTWKQCVGVKAYANLIWDFYGQYGNLGHLNSLYLPVCHPCRLPSCQFFIFSQVNLWNTHTHTKEYTCCTNFSKIFYVSEASTGSFVFAS